MSAFANVDLRRLRVFVHVVDAGGFSSAAKTLFSTQSTVSKSIQQLERGLGATLLERSGPRIVVTDTGVFVYEQAKKVLMEAAELFEGVDEIRAVRQGSLKIGFPRMGISALFAAKYARFRKQHPLIQVEFIPFSVPDLLQKVRSGEVDLAVSIAPVPGEFESFTALSSSTSVLLPEGHALAGKDVVASKELAGNALVLFEEGMPLEDVILRTLRRGGRQPVIACRTGQIDLLYGLVATGVGIAFVPSVVARTRRHPNVHTATLDDTLEWDIAYMWRRNAYLSHSARAWLAILPGDNPIEGGVDRAGSGKD